MDRCIPCAYPARYTAESVRWLRSEKLLCEKHREKADTMFPVDAAGEGKEAARLPYKDDG